MPDQIVVSSVSQTSQIQPNTAYQGTAEVAERMATIRNLADRAGLTLGERIYPDGTPLAESGEAEQRRLKQKWEDMPYLVDGVRALEAHIASIKPVDVKGVRTSQLMMDAQGSIGDPTTARPGIGYTRLGFSHLATYVRPNEVSAGFTSNLLAIHDGDLRSKVWNYHAARAQTVDGIVLRTEVDQRLGKRIIRAATSAKHSGEFGDDLEVARTLINENVLGEYATILARSKGRIVRENERTTFEAFWPMVDRQIVVGDLTRAGLGCRNSEVKAGALKIYAFVEQARCRNLTRVMSTDGQEASVDLRHIGDLRPRIRAAIASCVARIEPFVLRFADAYKDFLPEGMSQGELIAKVGRKFALPESTLNAINAQWGRDVQASQQRTVAALINSMTRVSQELTFDDADVLEEAAGRLVVNGLDALLN